MFGLKIDGDYVNIEIGDVNAFLDKLDSQFSTWEPKNKKKKTTKKKISKKTTITIIHPSYGTKNCSSLRDSP